MARLFLGTEQEAGRLLALDELAEHCEFIGQRGPSRNTMIAQIADAYIAWPDETAALLHDIKLLATLTEDSKAEQDPDVEFALSVGRTLGEIRIVQSHISDVNICLICFDYKMDGFCECYPSIHQDDMSYSEIVKANTIKDYLIRNSP